MLLVMNELCLTRSYLGTLSTGELAALADNYGVEFSADLERVFVIEKLLEAGSAKNPPVGAPDSFSSVRRHFFEASALPKQYRISYIEVMIRDPLWAYVFWEINERDREHYEGAQAFDGYCLRVAKSHTEDVFFTVPVGKNDASWYLSFQPWSGECRVDLCALLGETTALVTASAPFTLPQLLEPPNRKGLADDLAQVYRNPLAILSGADVFPVIRNTSRLPRLKTAELFSAG
jgi:hypothetical protein